VAEAIKFGDTKSNYGFLIAVFCGILIAEIYGKVLAVYII
jgi:hypothetical protein